MPLAIGDQLSAAAAALLGAAIGGAVSLLVALLAIVGQRLQAKGASAKDIENRILERKTRQISELYGPVLMLTRQSLYLSQKLREGKNDPKTWHLLDHLEEVKKNPTDLALAKEILEIDAKIEKLIVSKSGLVWGVLPEAFILFLGHYGALRVAFDEGRVPDDKKYAYYPTGFGEHIEEAYDSLRHDIDTALEANETRGLRPDLPLGKGAWSRIGPALGLVSVVLTVAGEQALGVYARELGYVLFIPFVVWLYSVLRPLERERPWLTMTSLAAGLAYSVVGLLSIVTGNETRNGIGHIVFGLFLLAAGIALVRTKSIFRWAGWVAVALGALVMLPIGDNPVSLGSLLWIALKLPFTTNPVGLGALLWIAVVSILCTALPRSDR